MKILIVEDSATLRHALGGYVTTAGHAPLFAHSGEEALQIIENTPVDMIFMDVEMPGLNGFETTRLIREWLNGHWIPIIFVTGQSDDKSFSEGIEAGGDDYLIKPVSSVILRAKIKALERISDMRNELQSLNEKLEILSQRDSLTQCYNRRTFLEHANQQWAQATRSLKPVSLLMMDIDHFKLYNDHYGHPAGDACLQQIAEAMQNSLHRPVDMLARYGGEEFIILLPETDLAGARKISEAIQENITKLQIEHSASTTHPYVTVSIGGSTSQYTTGRTLSDLINHADQLLYRAKATGRNCQAHDEFASHKTILVADNDPQTLEVIDRLLQYHCNVIATDNSQDCLELAEELHPDLILIDMHMPDLSAIDTFRTLRENTVTAHIPIIFMSSDHRDRDHHNQNNGTGGWLAKPLSEAQLVNQINRFLL